MLHFNVTVLSYNFYIYANNLDIVEFFILEKNSSFFPDWGQNNKKLFSFLCYDQHLHMSITALFSSDFVSSSRKLSGEWGGQKKLVFVELNPRSSWACDSSSQGSLTLKWVHGTAGLLSIWNNVLWHLGQRNIESSACWMCGLSGNSAHHAAAVLDVPAPPSLTSLSHNRNQRPLHPSCQPG